MRVELEIGDGGVAALSRAQGRVVARSRRWEIDRFELFVLGAFAALSLWVLALDLWQVVANGRVWTGTDGLYLVDQMQYLAWIRDASHHVLVSNMFVLRSTPADYFQPAVAISGALAALGLAPWLSLLLWKPVAVGSLFAATRLFVHRNIDGLWARRLALLLALFFASFSIVYGSFSVVGDLMPLFLSWGYTFGLLAVAAMVFGLLTYDRARAAGALSLIPGLLGALASLLHPWQGELLILIVGGSELVAWIATREAPRFRQAALTVVLTGLPLIYYMLLGRLDHSWQLARVASKHSFPLWTILLGIAPLALPAALAYLRPARGFLPLAVRVWPLATLAIYVLSGSALSATPLHAFQGITIPLAVLAVQGLRAARWERIPHHRLVTGVALAAATIPANVYLLNFARQLAQPKTGNANFISADERRALKYLEHSPVKGGVITRSYLGAVVPMRTGRKTFEGDCLWSEPRCYDRAHVAQALFDGSLAPEAIRAVVQLSGAKFVLSDCQQPADLRGALAPIMVSLHQFGCAAVYEVDAPGPPVGPLAQSGVHAAVRAPRRQ